MKSATALKGTKIVEPGSQTPFVHVTERDAAERFAAVVYHFEAGQLAQAARRTKEAAKQWKAAKRCPNGSSLINMARTIPAVRDWIMSEIGPADQGANAMNTIVAGLQMAASQPGPEGAAARDVLNRILRS